MIEDVEGCWGSRTRTPARPGAALDGGRDPVFGGPGSGYARPDTVLRFASVFTCCSEGTLHWLGCST